MIGTVNQVSQSQEIGKCEISWIDMIKPGYEETWMYASKNLSFTIDTYSDYVLQYRLKDEMLHKFIHKPKLGDIIIITNPYFVATPDDPPVAYLEFIFETNDTLIWYGDTADTSDINSIWFYALSASPVNV